MFKSILMKFARKVVEHVMSQLTQQLRIVTDQAFNPMQMMVQQVQGGIWRGDGADRFVQEVSSMMMPNTQRVNDTITTLNNNIRFAMDRIDQADNKASTTFQQLGDVFSKIF
jgi:uncharacterized protein YukE